MLEKILILILGLDLINSFVTIVRCSNIQSLGGVQSNFGKSWIFTEVNYDPFEGQKG